jgi:hypothetical protein
MVALENPQWVKVLVLDSNLSIPPVRLVGWPGTEKIGFLKNTLLKESRVLNSKCPGHFAWERSLKGE